jgi:hypothetical protein
MPPGLRLIGDRTSVFGVTKPRFRLSRKRDEIARFAWQGKLNMQSGNVSYWAGGGKAALSLASGKRGHQVGMIETRNGRMQSVICSTLRPKPHAFRSRCLLRR